jgi:hypothetical protein
MSAVREERIVSGIDEARSRVRLGDLTEDSQATEPGIEDEDGRRR